MTTLSILEFHEEAEWPAKPTGLSAAAAAIPAEVVWKRIESWISWRWGVRPATFIVEGGRCSWRSPLTPFGVATVEAWQPSDSWAAVELRPHPLGGYVLNGASHYRFSGLLGADDRPPADVLEAYKRLAEYMATPEAHPGAASFNEAIGPLTWTETRAPTWLARAMSYSGAADLLRPYRRAP
jgi:hypothetical protein